MANSNTNRTWRKTGQPASLPPVPTTSDTDNLASSQTCVENTGKMVFRHMFSTRVSDSDELAATSSDSTCARGALCPRERHRPAIPSVEMVVTDARPSVMAQDRIRYGKNLYGPGAMGGRAVSKKKSKSLRLVAKTAPRIIPCPGCGARMNGNQAAVCGRCVPPTVMHPREARERKQERRRQLKVTSIVRGGLPH